MHNHFENFLRPGQILGFSHSKAHKRLGSFAQEAVTITAQTIVVDGRAVDTRLKAVFASLESSQLEQVKP
jgi:type IV secretory pathway protease TraF